MPKSALKMVLLVAVGSLIADMARNKISSVRRITG
jgi:hypothetical protein